VTYATSSAYFPKGGKSAERRGGRRKKSKRDVGRVAKAKVLSLTFQKGKKGRGEKGERKERS